MTELEKIEELKEVYVQMILKEANQAAARVFTSQLKARQLEQDLVFTKQNSFRLFHVSKQIIQAKSKEAEVKLLNQEMEFDELECRLNETEGVILNLRDELNAAKERLSEEKKKARFSLWGNEYEKAMPEAGVSGYELLVSSLESGLGNVSVSDDGLFQERSTVDLKYECMERNYVAGTSVVNEISPDRGKSGYCYDSADIENVKDVEGVSVFVEKAGHGKREAFSMGCRSIRKRKVGGWGNANGTSGVRSTRQIKTPRRAFQCFLPWKSDQVIRCLRSGRRKYPMKYETRVEENLDNVQEISDGESELADRELIDVMVEQDFEGPQYEMKPIDVTVAEDVFVEQDTEDLLKDMELVDVIVEKDELAEIFDFNSSSSVVCGGEGIIVVEAPNVNTVETKGKVYFAYSRKRKRTTS